ncbi:UPF0236 family protein [Mycoplasma sp. T363T]|uniref:Mbov_0401 family ICE element transposase-like protein n=1 Tax=Mycoplasma bradburyae TaxID=2963128 RepID=UPI002341F6EA|nr:UPF0236 family protein [Mycoplasma bradburyae]MDC4163050.1 UPF0236 family protein [Mycoplasma bradburyae]
MVNNKQSELKNESGYLVGNYIDFQKEIAQFVVVKLKTDYENLDNQLYFNLRSKSLNNHIVVKDFRKRKIITQFGVVWIKRRRYFNKRIKRYIYLLDEKIELDKFSCYSKSFLEAIKYEILNNNFVLEKIRKQFIHKVSRTHFKQLLNKIVLKLKNEQNKKVNLISTKNLYINVDDTFIRFKINNKIIKKRLRLFLFHQGKNNNNELINVRYFITTKTSQFLLTNERAENNVSELEKIMRNFYKNKAKKLVLCSDGDREFNFLANKLKIDQSLDKWHLFYSYLFRTINPIKKEYDGIPKTIRMKLYKQLKLVCKECPRKLLWAIRKFRKILLNTDPNSKIAKGFFKLIKYVKNNLDGILFWNSKDYFATITEPYIFHKIKKIMGDKNKAYSLNTFMNLVLIKQFEFNNKK